MEHGRQACLGTGSKRADGGRCFTAYLSRVRPLIDRAVSDAVANLGVAVDDDGADIGDDLYRYLYRPLADFSCGGKRVRPALCLLGAEAVGVSPDRALSSAVAIELFQSAALIHDDIADRGELRRGAPCLHVREGIGVAVNVGDLALTAMFDLVIRDETLDCVTRFAILSELTSMARYTLAGQALDLGWARDGCWDATIEGYRHMALCKTAYYTAASPLACGALCGGATTSQVDDLRAFGLHVGLAFQLQDDLLNIVGDGEAQGKDYRSDITEGKRTMLVAYALTHLGPHDAAELTALLAAKTTDAADLNRATDLLERSGAIAFVRGEAQDLVRAAKRRLAAADINPHAAQILHSLADFVVERSA